MNFDATINPPRIVGLGRFLRGFTTRVDGKLFKPIWKADELSVDMTRLVTCRVYVKPSVFEKMHLELEELQLRIFNYVQPMLPTPRVMGAVNFGVQVVLQEREAMKFPTLALSEKTDGDNQ